jgi:large subunit ribosomal protein L29
MTIKAEEIHEMSDEAIEQTMTQLRRLLYDLKSQAVTEKLEDPSQLRKTRRDVARLMTEQTARKNAQETKA